MGKSAASASGPISKEKLLSEFTASPVAAGHGMAMPLGPIFADMLAKLAGRIFEWLLTKYIVTPKA